MAVPNIPRLELCGALLLTQLLQKVQSGLELDCPIHAWTDANVVLAWLKKHPSTWKPFVAHRIAAIQSAFSPEIWGHVSTHENPADAATRGMSPEELKGYRLWWHGPEWITKSINHWPQVAEEWTECQEERRTIHVVQSTEPEWDLLTRFSSLTTLIRTVAWITRFTSNARSRSSCSSRNTQSSTIQRSPDIEPLSGEEYQRALIILTRVSQTHHFKDEIICLSQLKPVKSTSSILRLRPFLDAENCLRIGGRLQRAFLSYDEKYPLILSKYSNLSFLLADNAHKVTLHGGTEVTRNYLLHKFWIIQGRKIITSAIRKCVMCTRHKAGTAVQIMAPLPEDRVKPQRPFATSGVDYAGPIKLRSASGRGHKSFKAYICLFICFPTKAIHLEVVSDLTTKGFLAAFKRFVSRRGHCSQLWSDNGTNFQGASAELKRMFKQGSDFYKETCISLAKDGTTWTFIPPSAPHHGGLWEAGVKSVKSHLVKIVGDHTLTFEEMTTLLCQIEAVLNSRPLYATSNDPTDLCPLTPGHFLIGESFVAIPESPITNTQATTSRYKQVTAMRNHFWNRWKDEYLQSLQKRHRWPTPKPSLKPGMMILIKNELCPPTKWPLARVLEVYPDKYGHVRKALLRTAHGDLLRPITKIVVLPINLENG